MYPSVGPRYKVYIYFNRSSSLVYIVLSLGGHTAMLLYIDIYLCALCVQSVYL